MKTQGTTLRALQLALMATWAMALAQSACAQGGGENPSFSATLNGPATNSYNLSTHRLLNVSLSDPENNTLEAWIYAGYSSTAVDGLIYHNRSLRNDTNILYNLTSMPLRAQDDPGIVLLMHLDNDSRYAENDTWAYDHSDQGRNGTAYGGAAPTLNGKYAGAYRFNGIDGYVDIGSTNLGKNHTISAWIKFLGLGADCAGSGNCNGVLGTTNGNFGFAFRFLDSDRIEYQTASPNNVMLSDGASFPAIGAWENWVIVRRDLNVTVYRNGAAVDSKDLATDDDLIIDRIGEASATNPWNGSIDEVAVWDRSLNASEVMDLHRLHNATSYWWNVNISNGSVAAVSETLKFTIGEAEANNPPTFGHKSIQPGAASGKDTYIANSSGGPFGAERTLQTGRLGPTAYRSAIFFNTSTIPAEANITSASLGLYLFGGSFSQTEGVFNLTSSWDDRYANWTHRTQSFLWGTPGGDYS